MPTVIFEISQCIYGCFCGQLWFWQNVILKFLITARCGGVVHQLDLELLLIVADLLSSEYRDSTLVGIGIQKAYWWLVKVSRNG